MTAERRPVDPARRWIWPFELKERIGEGGMGVVYRARYVVNNREVAVKILPDDVTNPVVLARFERELELLKNLNHPNIVRSFGGVCEDKHRFYAMELVEGGSLEDQLQERGRLPWEQVVAYGREMCAALAYLHQHGVVHRDVKPANFLISRDKRLKLSDFGLASVIAARRITTAGKTAGTILYMSPEQIRGGDITPQTDLYALGCVLYELLAGSPPYLGETPAATLNMHCHAPIPRVTQAAIDCPVALEQLVTQLLAKDPKDRPSDAVTVARALARITPTVKVVTRPRAIDSGEMSDASVLSTESIATRYKETRAVSRTDRPRRWPYFVGVGLIAVLAAIVGHLRPSAEKARRSESLWLEALRHPELPVRLNALESLGRLKTLSPAALDVVADQLFEETPEIRVAAAAALGDMGRHAKSQIAALHKVHMTDPYEEVRVQAKSAISEILADEGPDGPGWMAALSALVLAGAAGVVLSRKYAALAIDVPKHPRVNAPADHRLSRQLQNL